jgi:hypothetical protein
MRSPPNDPRTTVIFAVEDKAEPIVVAMEQRFSALPANASDLIGVGV